MYVYLERINALILTVSKVDLGFFFPFSQHSLQIYCKCYHSNYLLDKITGKKSVQRNNTQGCLWPKSKTNQTNTENDFGVTFIGQNSVIRIELIF